MNLIRFTLIFVLISQSSLMAQTVVEDTNLLFTTGSGSFQPPANHVGTIYKEPTDPATDPLNNQTSVSFDYDVSGENPTLTATDFNLDEGSDWYLVQEGEFFSNASIANGQFPLLFESDTPTFNILELDQTEFFLGVATSNNGIFNPPLRDTFGWVHLRRSGQSLQELEFIGSAVAYGGQGIVVGTSTAVVPEPNAIALLLFCTAAKVCTRRRRV